MKKQIELLAPGGDIDSIKAAIVAGADAVYCGLNKFNARDRAVNIDFESLIGVINLAHKNNCKIFLTLNIIIVENEIPSLINLLNKLINTKIDAVIVQDLGLFYILSKYYKRLQIHASTQLTTHNNGQIKFLNKLTASRVNLSRELSLIEIKELTFTGHENDIEIEVFVHGSYCISFSGICYMSSVLEGRSGNRGRCSQPCRNKYIKTREGNDFPLNLKDNSAYFDFKELFDAGVDSLKIEGRIKKADYVYTVTRCWKNHISNFFQEGKTDSYNEDLYKVFNRGFSNGFLKNNINKNMFIDNPKDNSIKQIHNSENYSSLEEMEKNRIKFYKEKDIISNEIKNRTAKLDIAKIPLKIDISGENNFPLKISIEMSDYSFSLQSKTNLLISDNHILNYKNMMKRFKCLNNDEYYIEELNLKNLQVNLFIPFKELTSLIKEVLFRLNDSKKIIEPINPSDILLSKKKLTSFEGQSYLKIKPKLSILISSEEDIYSCNESSAKFFFEIPSCLKESYFYIVDLFLKNNHLIPWFPSVLIGENYDACIDFLEQVKPELIITNNTGIGYEAYKQDIPWIAGPYLNLTNSFSFLSLKENFSCHGGFVSNEINQKQIKRIIAPENFKLYYSIYHPLLLMTSRQCLFQQVTGCEKNMVDNKCIEKCSRSASVFTWENIPLIIKKIMGNYHQIYNNINFLNTDIIYDLPDMFSGFLIDLRDIKTETKIDSNKPELINSFENLIHGVSRYKDKVEKIIKPWTNIQYYRGI